jgi:hypothetical protein
MNKHNSNILESTLSRFREVTGLNIQVLDNIYLEIYFSKENKMIYEFISLPILSKEQIYSYINLLKTNNKNAIIISKYVSTKNAEFLRLNNIFFIDSMGNMYIHNKSMLLYVNGFRINSEENYYSPIAFKLSGLKLIYELLSNPNLINENYRAMALATKLSLGSISVILKELREMKFWIELENGKKVLLQKKKLLEKLIIGFEQFVKPKLHIRKYKSIDNQFYPNWKSIRFQQENSFWGSECAASKLTSYLNPSLFCIYTEERKSLMKELKLIPDEKGYIEIRDVFWQPVANQLYEQTVSPLLIYIDLMLSEDERNIETAKLIYDKFLHDFFEKDAIS